MHGAERFGDFYINAAEFNSLLRHFIKSVDPDRFIFAAFLAQIRKHHTLGLFSIVRLHHVQAMMDLRQVLEAGAWAAYAIANTAQENFAEVDEKGFLDPSEKLVRQRNQWLDENFPAGSTAIRNMKNSINESAAHSNIVYAHTNFNFNPEEGVFETPFFDFEDEYLVKSDLWMAGNIAMGLMDLFYGVNRKLGVIKFADDFIPRLKVLEEQNHQRKEILKRHPRYIHIKIVEGEPTHQGKAENAP